MSYDLTIRGGEDRSVSPDMLERLLATIPGVAPGKGPTRQWIDPSSRMSLSIQIQRHEGQEQGTEIEDGIGNGNESHEPVLGHVTGLQLCIPYVVLAEVGPRALDLAFSLAGRLGWSLVDEQMGRAVLPADRDAALDCQKKCATGVLRLFRELGLPAKPPRPRRRGPTTAAILLGASAAIVVCLHFRRGRAEWGIHEAAGRGDLIALRQLLDRDPSRALARDPDGATPLHRAAQEGRDGAIQLLIEHGAPVDSRDAGGSTPLHRAAAAGQRTAVVRLLLLRAQVDLRDTSGRTPSDVARVAGHHDLMDLMKTGVPPAASDPPSR